jgi:crotonobetainyl-CoA:carnitine CoA-transferase CaiB-like acyl-CoA transferase
MTVHAPGDLAAVEWNSPVRIEFLKGLSVLELGDGVAGAAAGAVLASLGAEVTTVGAADAVIHEMRPGLPGGEDMSDSLLSIVLRAGKRVVTSQQDVQAADFDVVIVDRCDQQASDIDAYLESVAGENRGVWVTVSSFGLSGPRRRWRSTDFTLAAAGGLLGSVSDKRTGTPVRMAGCQALLSVGHVAALAACHGIDERRRTGRSVHVDVSAQEAVAATGPVLRLSQELLGCVSMGGSGRFGAPAGLYRCKDGFVHIMAMEDHQWRALVKELGEPDWAKEYMDPSSRIDQPAAINAHLEATLSSFTKVEAEQRLQRGGVPATAMYGPAELLDVEQYTARGSMASLHTGASEMRAMTSPYVVVANDGDVTAGTRGIGGLRVAEVGHVLAVPLCAALLGAMGAVVTKIEDPARLDMYRRNGPYVDGEPGPDRSAYFAVMNHSKTSSVVELEDAVARNAALDGADVVIENLGPRRARHLGLDCRSVSAARPEVLAVSSSGFGHEGPWSGYRAYAYNLHTSTGLAHLTCIDGEPAQIDVAWADLISGFALATAVAAWAVGRTSANGAAVDFSMAELAIGRFNEFLAAAALHLDSDGAEGGLGLHRQAPYAPQRAYRTIPDGPWLAVSVRTDDEWRALCGVLDDPEQLRTPQYATAAGRRDDADALDREIETVLEGRSASSLARELQEAGVPASVVLTAADLVADEHLAQRGFFPEIEHPLWGRRRLIGIPWRFVGQEPFSLTPPPRLGSGALD